MTNWEHHYKLTTAPKAIQAIESGMRVFMTGNCSVPKVLLDALIDYAPNVNDVEIVEVLTVGAARLVDPSLEGHLRVNTLFISGDVRDAVNACRADFTPVFLSQIPMLYRTDLPINVALIQVSPPDSHGYCSFGVEVGVTKTAAEVADIVIAEVNRHMPRTLGDSFIHVRDIDYMVPVDYPLPEFEMSTPSATQDAIGRHVASLIEDGSTLQTGIGGIPNAVLDHLGDRRDLGIHTELFSDGVVDLVDKGVITNARKSIHPGKIVAGFVLGSRKLYKFVHDNPIVEFHPTEYVNDPFLIAKNDRMVAINSAIEVDLTGQVCADSIGHRLYSGVGGQVDFIRGASRSLDGRPIIALPSTAKGGTVTRIVSQLKPGAGVTTSRNDVHYVATEYGVVKLHGLNIQQRVRGLINIAAPEFREQLEAEAREFHYLPPVFQGVGEGE